MVYCYSYCLNIILVIVHLYENFIPLVLQYDLWSLIMTLHCLWSLFMRFYFSLFAFMVWCCYESCLWHYIVSLLWHHNDRDDVSNHQPHNCLLNRLFRHRSKIKSKLHITGLCEGNSLVTSEFSAQRARNVRNFFIWWCHHVFDMNRLFLWRWMFPACGMSVPATLGWHLAAHRGCN